MFELEVREATVDDVEFVVSLVPRLVEFGPPPWRDPRHMMATDRQVLTDALGEPAAGAAVFIAETDGRRLGFVHLNTSTDYYTKEHMATSPTWWSPLKAKDREWPQA